MIESTGRSGRTSDATTPKVPMVLVSCHRVSTCMSPVSIRAGQPAYCVTRDMAAIAAIRGSTVVVYMIKGGLSSIPNTGPKEGCCMLVHSSRNITRARAWNNATSCGPARDPVMVRAEGRPKIPGRVGREKSKLTTI